jgi:hypothetical protein
MAGCLFMRRRPRSVRRRRWRSVHVHLRHIRAAAIAGATHSRHRTHAAAPQQHGLEHDEHGGDCQPAARVSHAVERSAVAGSRKVPPTRAPERTNADSFSEPAFTTSCHVVARESWRPDSNRRRPAWEEGRSERLTRLSANIPLPTCCFLHSALTCWRPNRPFAAPSGPRCNSRSELLADKASRTSAGALFGGGPYWEMDSLTTRWTPRRQSIGDNNLARIDGMALCRVPTDSPAATRCCWRHGSSAE